RGPAHRRRRPRAARDRGGDHGRRRDQGPLPRRDRARGPPPGPRGAPPAEAPGRGSGVSAPMATTTVEAGPDPEQSAPGTDAPDVAVISVSIDLGAGRRGVDMGPSAIRIAGLTPMLAGLGYDVREVGTVTAAGSETTDP